MADNIENISSGGVVHAVADAVARAEILRINTENNILYAGQDLTQVFASEIAAYSDVWAWVKARCAANNFEGIHVGDYIPLTVGSETVYAQVAGIDTYYDTTDQAEKHHIDFISRDCLADTVQWNTGNNNNGSADDNAPYMVSNVRKYLLETVYPKLPTALKNVIKNKRFLLETRYSASGALDDSTGWGWRDVGALWIPTEYEVFGSVIWGTKGYSAGQAVQYPIFANNWINRIKGAGHNGGRAGWWLASVYGGGSAYACYVGSDGYAYSGYASYALRMPLCFRISA